MRLIGLSTILLLVILAGANADIYFQDDFNSGNRNNWEDLTAGKPWSVYLWPWPGDFGYVFGTDNLPSYTRVKNAVLGDFTLQVQEFSIGNGEGDDGGVLVRQQGSSDQNLLLLVLRGQQVFWKKRTNGAFGAALGSVGWSDSGNHVNQLVNITLTAAGESFSAHLAASDGTNAFANTSVSIPGIWLTGGVGLYSNRPVHDYWHNFDNLVLNVTSTEPPPDSVAIGIAKSGGPGWSGNIKGMVTAIFSDYNSCVIESEDRSSGITMKPIPASVQMGQEIVAAGSVQADGTFAETQTWPTGRVRQIAPVAVSNRNIVGAVPDEGLPNTDLLVTAWGKVLDSNTIFPDGSVRFHMTDDLVKPHGPTVDVPGGGTVVSGETLVFEDSFDAGKKPAWVDYSQATTAQNGKLEAYSESNMNNITCVSGQSIKDAKCSVDATAGLQMGILLRYQDNNNFVLAFYTPGGGNILGIHERLNGNWGNWINPAPATGLSGTARMVAQVVGSTVTVTLTDASHSYATSCTLGTLLGPGLVGVYHDPSVYPDAVYFDNFQAYQVTTTTLPKSIGANTVQVAIPPSVTTGMPLIGELVKVTGIAGKGVTLSGALRSVMLRQPTDFSRIPIYSGPPLIGLYPPVTVSWDGTGDFGPNTPGTATAGIQEAINYCIANHRDLYLQGGWKGPVFNVSDTIRIPATTNFRIDSGINVINWTGPSDKDLICFDSARDCRYTFGILVYGGLQSILRVKPQTTLAGDDHPIFADSEIRGSSLADPSPFSPGPRQGIGGVVFDTSLGEIRNNDFYFQAILNFNIGILTPGNGSLYQFADNKLQCQHLHSNGTNSTLISIGAMSERNTFAVANGGDQGATGISGADIYGSNNVVDLQTRGGLAGNRYLIFEPSASGNKVNFMVWPGADTMSMLTDLATNPTNQLMIPGGAIGFNIFTAPTGTYTYTQRLCPATVRVVGGTVSSVQLLHGSDTIDCGASAGDGVCMCPGDRLQVTSSVAPSVQVIPSKVK